MNSIRNQVSLSQLSKLTLEKGSSSKIEAKVILAFMAELYELGYKADKSLVTVLKTLSLEEIKAVHKTAITYLTEQLGAYVRHQPLFKNFPSDIPKTNEAFAARMDSFLNGYLIVDEAVEGKTVLTCGLLVDSSLLDEEILTNTFLSAIPVRPKKKNSHKRSLESRRQLRSLGVMTTKESDQLIKNLISAKSAISPKSKEDLKKVFESLGNEVANYLPTEMAIKENVATIGSMIVKHTTLQIPKAWLKTATDVLRLAVGLSEGDVSLKTPSNFKLKNRERKIVLRNLNRLQFTAEDMLRNREKWLRLGEYLHIGASKEKYQNAYQAFDAIRNHERSIETFNRKAQRGMTFAREMKNPRMALDVLKARPGELARRIDVLLRTTNDQKVITEFSEVIEKVATPLLLKLNKFLGTRSKKAEFRHFLPKGQVAKIWFQDGDNRENLSKSQIEKTQEVIKTELARRFNKGPALKKVYIDPSLKKIIVPLAQRSASKALVTVERGSRVAFDGKTHTLRLFAYWHENEKTGRVDLDLSAGGFDKDWNFKTHIDWTSLSALNSAHSGDITSAPNGASEFIDIHLDSFRKAGIRYVVMNLFNFTGNKFKDFTAFAGFMERSAPKSGEVFDPTTVKNKFDLAGDTTTNLPMIADLEKNELIWCDLSMGDGSGRRIGIHGKQISWLARSVASMEQSQPTLFELFTAHAEARGAVVVTKKVKGEEYDLEIDQEKAKDIADIMANWI